MGNFCHIRYKKYYVKCFSMRFDLVWDVSTIFFNNNIFLQNKKKMTTNLFYHIFFCKIKKKYKILYFLQSKKMATSKPCA